MASAVAGLAVTGMTAFNMVSGSCDGIAINISAIGSASVLKRGSGFGFGIQYGGGVTIFLSWRHRDVFIYPYVEFGTAPLASFPKAATSLRRSGLSFGVGLVFNVKSPSDLTNNGYNAYWPIAAMAGVNAQGVGGKGGSAQSALDALWRSARGKQGWQPLGDWHSYMTTLARYVKELKGTSTGMVNSRPGSLYFSTGGFDSFGTIGFAARDINFGTTMSYSWGPLAASSIKDYFASEFGDFVSEVASGLRIHAEQIKVAAESPDLLGARLGGVLGSGGLL